MQPHQSFDSFRVLEFSEENFNIALSNEYCSPEEVGSLSRTKYLLGYLRDEEIGAHTLIVEYDYIDGDYLDDYSSYYVKCFRLYNRHCKRLHFFALEFQESDFIEIVRGTASKDKIQAFKDSYRGFIVARPLPSAIIGRTVLSTYSSNGSRRHYPSTKDCKANLFGLELSIRSLEYQEQDSVLAACATVALWSCLHKTGELFQTPQWSPATITRTANEIILPSRPIPSHGLNPHQIHHAILKNGLAAEIFNPPPHLAALLYGYMKAGLPVILGIDIEGVGLHAITLTGYSLRPEAQLPQLRAKDNFVPFSASRIDKFYVHDDQIGPFTRIWVKPEGNMSANRIVFDGSWKTEAGKYRIMLPEVIIIPIYHKIRVTFLDIQQWLVRLNWAIFNICRFPDNASLEWDLFLSTTNDFKRDIKTTYHENEAFDTILFTQHPRFIWRAILRLNNTPLLELLGDATDMSRSFPFYQMIVYEKRPFAALKQFIDDPSQQDILRETVKSSFVDFLKKNLSIYT